MPKYLLLFILLLNFLKNGHAQDVKYYPNPNLDKFVGTWTYENNVISVSIALKKSKVTAKNLSTDIIEGYHMYKNGQQIMENPAELTLKNGSTFTEDGKNTPYRLHLGFYDPSKKKGQSLTLTMSPDNPNELTWSMD